MTTTCPRCGTAAPGASAFCGVCGARMSADEGYPTLGIGNRGHDDAFPATTASEPTMAGRPPAEPPGALTPPTGWSDDAAYYGSAYPPPPGPYQEIPPQGSSSRGPLVIAAVAAAAVLGAGGTWWLLGREEAPAPSTASASSPSTATSTAPTPPPAQGASPSAVPQHVSSSAAPQAAPPAAAPQPAAPPAAPPPAAPPPAAAPPAAPPAAAPAPAENAPGAAAVPAGSYVLVLESLPKSERSAAEALEVSASLPGTTVVDSSATRGMTPGYWAVISGEWWSSSSAAADSCRAYGRSASGACYPRRVG